MEQKKWTSWGDHTNQAESQLGEHWPKWEGQTRVWWTAEEAADAFNVTVREINERYRPLMPPGTVLPALKERVYSYDFEREGYEWSEYAPEECMSVDPFNRSYDVYVECVGGHVPEDEGDELVFMAAAEAGYDHGLEPESRGQVVVSERLYLRDALLTVRWGKLRRKRREQPRGERGRFVKKSA